jgi:ComF family protein
MSMSILSRQKLYIGAKLNRMLPAQPCLLCGASSRTGIWCAECDADLPYLTTSRCPLCALPTPLGEICGHCLTHPPRFDRSMAVFAYAFPVDKLIQALKFEERLSLIDGFAEKLAPHIDHRPDYILPMPLHLARLAHRGFDQSLELAKQLSSRLDIPLLARACRRIRDTAPQSGLPWKERKKNMHDAFACTEDMTGKHVALLDDVMTTGASLNELAKTVRRAGACEVSAWAIARTLPHSV